MWRYYVLRIALVTWVVAVAITAVLQLNATVPHTYFFGATSGVLYSERFTSRAALALIFSSFRLCQFLAICGLLTFAGRSARIFWTILLGAFVLFELVALALNGGFLGECNATEAGNRANPCNALNWCCVPEVFRSSASGCRNSGVCTTKTAVTSAGELTRNVDFKWTLALNVVMAAVGVLAQAIALWHISDSSRGSSAAAQTAFDRLNIKGE